MKNLVLLFPFLLCAYSALSQETCDLRVKVENIKNIKGSMMIAIFNHEDHFLSNEIASGDMVIESSSVEFSFKGLGKGTYAISIFQDENDNGRLDTNFIGIPSEPYAFSNNAQGMFGPPSFEQCKFEIKGGDQEIVISL